MRTRDARVVYLVLESATALLDATAWTTAAVYLINTAHLGPLQLVLLGTVMEASVLVFEIPTGVVADAVGPLFLRAAQYGRLAAMVGIGLSVGLANRALGLPLVVAGLLQIALGGWLTLAMPETGFRPAAREQRSSWRQVVRTAHGGLAARLRPRRRVRGGRRRAAGVRWRPRPPRPALRRLGRAHDSGRGTGHRPVRHGAGRRGRRDARRSRHRPGRHRGGARAGDRRRGRGAHPGRGPARRRPGEGHRA